ncbi:hypothetical protein [Chitinophaga sp. LS1]|uniref:hypothetical protein n=1 Tax=Chitinophaga sp. LS1 TaxID=3051176 RepID=UPI002AAA85F4|nr:hypothetical protein [Chitinophaga sp. LS1]WPV66301.1 hypothetical protein QQL36_31375 [Chitinophaga sp. LS1]
MKPEEKIFLQGYVCALVQLIYQQDGRTSATDELFRWKIQSIDRAKEAGCIAHDINVLIQYYG